MTFESIVIMLLMVLLVCSWVFFFYVLAVLGQSIQQLFKILNDKFDSNVVPLHPNKPIPPQPPRSRYL